VSERLVTARELGELLGLAPGTILDKWERNELPGYKIGRAVRFDPDEILKLTRREGGPALAAVRTEA
jgi:excisionase family DNA binding protein